MGIFSWFKKKPIEAIEEKGATYIITKNGKAKYKKGAILKTQDGKQYKVMPNGEWRKI